MKKINDTESLLEILLTGVQQGSILGQILFNIFLNDLFLFIKEAKLANFADDNTIYTESRDIDTLLKLLEEESKTAINWFKENEMIVNPNKFQAMVVGRGKEIQNEYTLNINDEKIKNL